MRQLQTDTKAEMTVHSSQLTDNRQQIKDCEWQIANGKRKAQRQKRQIIEATVISQKRKDMYQVKR